LHLDPHSVLSGRQPLSDNENFPFNLDSVSSKFLFYEQETGSLYYANISPTIFVRNISVNSMHPIVCDTLDT
jgi:hypothetical protein